MVVAICPMERSVNICRIKNFLSLFTDLIRILLLLVNHLALQGQWKLPDRRNGDLLCFYRSQPQLLELVHVASGFRSAEIQDILCILTIRNIHCKFTVLIDQLFGEPVLTQERYENRPAPFDSQHTPGNGHGVDLIIRLRRQKHTFLQFFHDLRQIIVYIYLFSVHRFLLKITLIHCPSCLPGSASPVSHIRSRSKQFSSARSLSIFFSSKSV